MSVIEILENTEKHTEDKIHLQSHHWDITPVNTLGLYSAGFFSKQCLHTYIHVYIDFINIKLGSYITYSMYNFPFSPNIIG